MPRFNGPIDFLIIYIKGKGHAFRRKQLNQASRNFNKIEKGNLGEANITDVGSVITVKEVERVINETLKGQRQLNKDYYWRGRPLPIRNE